MDGGASPKVKAREDPASDAGSQSLVPEGIWVGGSGNTEVPELVPYGDSLGCSFGMSPRPRTEPRGQHFLGSFF